MNAGRTTRAPRRPRGARTARAWPPDAGSGERALAWPGDPEGLTAAGIDFEALAHVLANTCRWGGRTRRYWSVAQHAVVLSEEIGALDGLGREERRTLALHALLAGARIAWLGDMQAGGGPASARAAERARRDGAAVDRAVREAAGLEAELSAEQADVLRFVGRMADAAVCRDLPEAGTIEQAGATFPPLRRRMRPTGPAKAARLWLARFRELTQPPGTSGSAAAAAVAADNAHANETGEQDGKENDDVAHLAQTQGRNETERRIEGDAGERLAA